MYIKPQTIRFVKESSGAKSTTESFKYKAKDCDISTSSAKPLVQVREQFNQLNQPFKKTPKQVDKRIVERTLSAVRTSNYVKRSSVAPDKRQDTKSVVYEKRIIKIPFIAPAQGNVIDERMEDDQVQGQGDHIEQEPKRRKSITLFELSTQPDTQDEGIENIELFNYILSLPEQELVNFLQFFFSQFFIKLEKTIIIKSTHKCIIRRKRNVDRYIINTYELEIVINSKFIK